MLKFLSTFLQQKLSPINGNVVEIPDDLEIFKQYSLIEPTSENVVALANPFIYTPELGTKVTEHIGAHYYTIGQRRGLKIGGRPEPSFVIGIDIPTNTVYSGMKDTHPGLNKFALKINKDDFHYISKHHNDKSLDGLTLSIMVRYRQSFQEGSLHVKEDGYYVLFKEKQRGITPGQFAAFYINDELIASGVIHY